MCTRRTPRAGRTTGFTLIELIVFIVIVGVGLAGILSVLSLTVQHSADPMVRKQMLAIAESLLEEVTLMPFTYCDPDDANAATTTTGTAGCAAAVEAMGAEAGETRGSAATPFDNVNDYDNLSLPTVTDAAGGHAYAGYSASIAVTAGDDLGPAGTIAPNDATPANTNVLRVAVTVTRGTDSLTLHGYRTRHSPTLLP